MRIGGFAGVVVVAALIASPAQAQNNNLYFSPDLTADMTAPSAFDGLYAGVLIGAISSRHNNFHVGGEDIRPDIGGIVGWNQPVAPGVIIGGELQATIATDFSGSSYLRAMAVARLGFAAGDNGLIYLLGGVGRVGEGWAGEFGMGAEVMVTDNMALRLEAAGIGQLGDVPNGNNSDAISAMRISSAAVWQLDGGPAKTTFNSGPVTSFTGPYAGVQIGGFTDPQFNFFKNYGYGWHLSRFELGGFAGYNWALNDYFRAGVEAQLGFNFDTSGDKGGDALVLARLGVVPFEGIFAYTAAGVGVAEGNGAYAAGGGVEYALWGQTSLRAEGLVIGRLDGFEGPSTWRYSTPTTKVTLGAVWHFD
ncbi:hypothetical protein [Devosia sp. 2618]|uniref:hypothetical protein n=1 Tax=Devosia sp. 2618 TaxID=3156454 RepID=UPI0033952961